MNTPPPPSASAPTRSPIDRDKCECDLLRGLVESIPDILFYKDRGGVYLGCNSLFADFVGRAKEEIVGHTDFDLFPHEVAESFRRYDGAMLQSGQPQHNEEWITYPDGRRVLCDTFKAPLHDQEGLVGLLGVSRDITARKTAEESLRTSDANLASLFSSMRDLLFILDYEGRILCVNQVVLDVLGYAEDELVWQSVAVVHPSELRAKAGATFQRMLARQQLQCDIPLMTKAGAQIPVDTQVSFGQWNGKEALFGISRDVTERTHAEQAFRRLNQIQRQLMRLATEFVNVPVDRQNDAIQQALATIGELINADRAYLFDYDFAGGVMCNTNEWCASGVAPQIHELQQVPVDLFPAWVEAHRRGESVHVPRVDALPHGEPLWQILAPQGIQSLITLPLMSPNGCLGFVGFDAVRHERQWGSDEVSLLRVLAELFANFSMRRMMEQRLRHVSEERGMLLDTMDAQVYYLTNEDTYGLVNRAHAEFLGFPREQIENQPRDLFCPPNLVDGLRAIRRRVFADGEPAHEQLWLPNSRGEQRLLDMRLTPKRGADGKCVEYVVCVAHDVTEMRRLQEHLERARDDAQAAAKAKSLFLANMSHEIRTPLNAILGYAQLMTRSCRSCTTHQRGIETILTSGEHLLDLLNSILYSARNDSLEDRLNLSDFSLHQLLREIEQLFGAQLHSDKLQILVSWSDDVPAWIRSDSGKIRQVLINLVTNAVKYTPQGTVRVEAALLAARAAGTAAPAAPLTLAVRVIDSGAGISKAFLPHLFEPFQQQEPAGGRMPGVGLGLPISLRLARALGGEITASSVVGQGSTFCFTFRADVASPPLPENLSPATILKVDDAQPRRLLVVDDDAANRNMLCDLLQEAGFSPRAATSGHEALALLEQGLSFDAVLLDKCMPGLDGLETIRQIRAKLPRHAPPILLVTASNLDDALRDQASDGVDGYVDKPLRRSQLLQEIRRVTGVRYRYAAPAAPAAESARPQLSVEALRHLLAELPPDLVAAINTAIRLGDIGGLRAALETLRTLCPPLAGWMAPLVQRYDYEALQEWVSHLNKET